MRRLRLRLLGHRAEFDHIFVKAEPPQYHAANYIGDQDPGRSKRVIVTGDLGKLGKEVIFDFFQKDGIELTNYDDCGTMIFDLKKQDVHVLPLSGAKVGGSHGSGKLSEASVQDHRGQREAFSRNYGRYR